MRKKMTDQERQERRQKYEHNALPAEITRRLFVMYGIDKNNHGQIEISDYEMGASDYGNSRITLCDLSVSVKIPKKQNIKGKVLEVLQAEKNKVLADNHQRLKSVQDKIDNLLAIEHKGGNDENQNA